MNSRKLGKYSYFLDVEYLKGLLNFFVLSEK